MYKTSKDSIDPQTHPTAFIVDDYEDPMHFVVCNPDFPWSRDFRNHLPVVFPTLPFGPLSK